MTVEELLTRMSAAELAEWQAYYVCEPFGEDWKQTSYLCSMVGNAAGGHRRGKFEPEDFLPVKPTIAQTAKRQSSDEMLAIFKQLAGKK